jgi:hypothetical protein
VSDLPSEPKVEPEGVHLDRTENARSPQRSWLGKLATGLAGFVGGMAVNDFSGSLGYHGLLVVVTLTAVITAAAWIRGLHPLARLSRHAPWLFMTPAAGLAVIAAFTSGPAVSILTAIAAILTLGAVLMTKELLSAAVLFDSAARIAIGAVVIEYGLVAFASHQALMGASSMALGAGLITYGAAAIAERDALMDMAKSAQAIAAIPFAIALAVGHDVHMGGTLSGGAANLAKGAAIAVVVASIAGRIAVIVKRRILAMRALIASGVACIVLGIVSIVAHYPLVGVGGIALGAAPIVVAVRVIGPRAIVARVRRAIDWATKVPGAAGTLDAESGTGGS